MTATLLALIALLLAARLYQSHRQHRELLQWIDALAEMVGEAIDKERNNDNA